MSFGVCVSKEAPQFPAGAEENATGRRPARPLAQTGPEDSEAAEKDSSALAERDAHLHAQFRQHRLDLGRFLAGAPAQLSEELFLKDAELLDGEGRRAFRVPLRGKRCVRFSRSLLRAAFGAGRSTIPRLRCLGDCGCRG